MLTLFAVVALVSAAVLLVSYHLWRENVSAKELYFDDPGPREFRSLFEEDFEAFELEEKAKAASETRKKQEQVIAERAASIQQCRAGWISTPTIQNTIELLALTVQHGKADLFSETASEIIAAFRLNDIAGLSARELAGLLESHYRLLPAAERSSGELFLLKQNIAELAAERN
jgi:hypothetical protein